jgi:hypothetical protein
MGSRRPALFSGLWILVAVTAISLSHVDAKKVDYHPTIDPANFQSEVDNPYFPLVPGTTYAFTEKVGKEVSENEVTVTHDTKTILGVKCIVVHDTVKRKGVLKEETFDWYAQDKEGTVWYMGEDTKEFLGGKRVSTEGSWEAGVDGAQPGIMMVKDPKPGDPYRQEYLADRAEDMGQIVELNVSVTVPYGTFTGCIKTKEWSMLEAGHENKWYCKGLGVVRTESTAKEVATLVSVTKP